MKYRLVIGVASLHFTSLQLTVALVTSFFKKAVCNSTNVTLMIYSRKTLNFTTV